MQKDKKCKLIPFKDNSGEEHFIKDEEELFKYIKKKYLLHYMNREYPDFLVE